MARDYKRDYRELPKYAKGFIGKHTVECIDSYAAKRQVVTHRIGKCFWGLVDDGIISIAMVGPLAIIISVNGDEDGDENYKN